LPCPPARVHHCVPAAPAMHAPAPPNRHRQAVWRHMPPAAPSTRARTAELYRAPSQCPSRPPTSCSAARLGPPQVTERTSAALPPAPTTTDHLPKTLPASSFRYLWPPPPHRRA